MYPCKFPNTNVYTCVRAACRLATLPPPHPPSPTPTTTTSPSLDQFFHDTSPYLLSPQVSPRRVPVSLL